MGFFPILLCFSLYSAYSILLHLRPFGVIFLFLKEINLLMGLLEIKFLDNSGATSYLNFVYLKYLRNCGFALRAVPNSIVSPSLNNQITRLFNSPSKEGKEALETKPQLLRPRFALTSLRFVRGAILRLNALPNCPTG